MITTESRLHAVEQQNQRIDEQLESLRQMLMSEMIKIRQDTKDQLEEIGHGMMQQQQMHSLEYARDPNRSTEPLSTGARGSPVGDETVPVHTDAASSKGKDNSNNHVGVLRSASAVSNSDRNEYDLQVLSSKPHSFAAMALSSQQGLKSGATRNREAAVLTSASKEVLTHYRSQLDAIYDFYTATADVDIFKPRMHLAHFSRFVRDCGLVTTSSGTSSELLWMSVIRALDFEPRASLLAKSNRNRSLLMTRGKYDVDESNKHHFAVCRMECISRKQFGSALSVLATELEGHIYVAPRRILATTPVPARLQEEALLSFLMTAVLPKTRAAMHSTLSKRRTGISSSVADSPSSPCVGTAVPFDATCTIADYATSGTIQEMVRRYMPRIRQTFLEAMHTCQGPASEKEMSVYNFMDVVRRYGLLSDVTKNDIKTIFEACIARGSGRPSYPHRSSKSESSTITLHGFVDALCCLAERVYGVSALCGMYPTAESRMEKLLVKMYVLQ